MEHSGNQNAQLVEEIAHLRQQLAEREAELQSYQLQVASLLEFSQEAIISLDSDHRIVLANKGAETIFGYTQAELIGQPLNRLIPAYLRSIHTTHIEQFVASPEMSRLMHERKEILGLRQSGEEFAAEASIAKQELAGKTILTVILRDISHRKQTELELLESRDRYRVFSELSSDYVYSLQVGQAGTKPYRWITDIPFQRVTGYSIDDLRDVNSIYHPEDRARADRDLALTMEKGIATQGEYRIITRSGEERWLYISRRAEWNEDRTKIICIYGAAKDITASKQADEQLRVLWRAIEQSPTSIVITNDQGLIEYVNPHFTELTGFAPEEVIGENPRILRTDQTPPEVHQDMWQTITAGLTWHGEFINRKKNDEHFLESVSISPVRAKDGRITHFVAVKEDITDKRHAEELLRESEERYRLLAENVTDVIWTMDAQGRLLYVSQSIQALLDRTFEEALSHPLEDLLAPDQIKILDHILKRYQSSTNGNRATTITRFELTYLHRDGTLIPTEVVARALYDPAGQFVGILGITRDMRERLLAENQRTQLAIEQERNRTLSKFVNDSTHDLMTSLSIIKINLQIARKTQDAAQRENKFTVIQQQVNRLQNIVQDTLILIRLDNMRPEQLQLQNTLIRDLLQNQIETFRTLIQLRGHNLTLHLPQDPLFAPIEIDFMRLALGKLLENAIHYTPDGGSIDLGAMLVDNALEITISDTGIGIDPADLPHIFERFFRAEQHRPADQGTGLGLTIVQAVVNLHGGSIEVTSTPGAGTTFRILLPYSS